ncbi:hypothetical protein VKY48_26235 [Endobacterium cereale]|nr:hypothetical protein [Endobacterium cereale]MEB2847941.1 hypothetical protein [Endobacterium cereale]
MAGFVDHRYEYIRVVFQEWRECLRHVLRQHVRVGKNPDSAAAPLGKSLEIDLELAGVVEYRAGVPGEHVTRERRPYATSRSLEKNEIESAFQPLQPGAQSSNDEVVLLGCCRKASAVERRDEYLEIGKIEFLHCFHLM